LSITIGTPTKANATLVPIKRRDQRRR